MSRQNVRGEDFLGTEFNEFLFAPVNVGLYGEQFNVVSALARLDLDAWAEAKKLALLPREIATGKLSELLTKATGISQTAKEIQEIAEQLIVLLPSRAWNGSWVSAQYAGNIPVVRVGFATLTPLLILALMICGMSVLVGMQISAQVDAVLAPPATAAALPMTNTVLH